MPVEEESMSPFKVAISLSLDSTAVSSERHSQPSNSSSELQTTTATPHIKHDEKLKDKEQRQEKEQRQNPDQEQDQD